MSMEIKGAEWLEWSREPQTRALLDLLRETVRQCQDQWLNHDYEDQNPHAWATKNAAGLAVAGWIQAFITSIENIEGAEEDGK